MGLTSSLTFNNKGNSIPILTSNSYKLHSSLSNAHRRKVTIDSMNTKQYEEWQLSLKGLQKFNEYLQLPRHYVWRVDCLCSDYGRLQIEYQERIYTLNDEIGYRMERQQYFKEYEIWYMLFLIITLQFNASREIMHYSHWNIHPNSIIITQEGYLKLLLTLAKETEDHPDRFVPPEEIPFLLLQLIQNTDERVIMRINKEISETFQLGLTLLSAANLKNYSYLYKHSPLLNLNIDKLNGEIDKCTEFSRYTLVLTSLIANLCSFNPALRLSGPELWEWVNDHAEEIKRRSPFNFRYIPKKLSALVEKKIKNNQQDLLRNSQLKMERLSNSQIDLRKNGKSPERTSMYEKHLYQPIHQVNWNLKPHIPRYRSSKD